MAWLDVSNHNGALNGAFFDQWSAQGFDGLIAQAINPPVGFPRGVTDQQLRAAKEHGWKVGIYVWLWHDYSGDALRQDIRRRLATVPDDVELDMRPWLDVEDLGASRYPLADNLDDVRIALEEIDAWAAQRGLPPAGIYTGRWFWEGYLGNVAEFGDRPLWDANYDGDNEADRGFRRYGAWTKATIKQSGSDPIDMNDATADEDKDWTPAADEPVLNYDAETGALVDPPVAPIVDEPWQAKRELVISTLGLIHGDELDALLKAPNKQARKQQAERIRALIDQALAA